MQTLKQVICTRVLRLILAASVYADLTILRGVTKGLSQKRKLLKILHRNSLLFTLNLCEEQKQRVSPKINCFFSVKLR